MIHFENLGYLSIIVMLAMICLIVFIAYKVIIKKERPKNYYTPYDYIVGQTDKEFHDDQLEVEVTDVKKDKNDI